MDAQLLDALADILADAFLADLEAEVAEVEAVSVSTANPTTGSGSQLEHPATVSSSEPDAA
jgi:hypothetical protein